MTKLKGAPVRKAEWYDYPQYYDLGFQDETEKEIEFLQNAVERFGTGGFRRVLEPGCGTGRLVVGLAQNGFEVTGFDLNPSALKYLEKQLKQRGLSATIYLQDMSKFEVTQPYDMVLNTFNTFRHLLKEDEALSHLKSVARSLRRGGLFFLGLHVMPYDADAECTERWWATTGRTRVCFTLKVKSWDQRRRLEELGVSMLIRKPNQPPLRVRTEMTLRTYRYSQLKSLLAKVPELEFVESFDFWYEIDEPIQLSNLVSDVVLVLRKT